MDVDDPPVKSVDQVGRHQPEKTGKDDQIDLLRFQEFDYGGCFAELPAIEQVTRDMQRFCTTDHTGIGIVGQHPTDPYRRMLLKITDDFFGITS